MNLQTFRLGTLVVHDVPQPSDEREELILTEAAVPLDNQLRGYFERKITESLGDHGLEIVADPTGSDAVRNGVATVLDDPAHLVPVSQTMARHLDASQTRRNPAGLLAIGFGTLDQGHVVAVLKLEREQGVRLHIEVVGDHTEVDLEFLRELTLTDKTRIFKASLLRLTDTRDPLSMYGLASDDQRGRDEGTGIADFFLATFLGCQLRTNPEKATRDFVRAAEEFINRDVQSNERRAEYHIALLAKMQDQTRDLRPRTFASEHLRAHDRPRFLERVAAYDLDPDLTFEKDTTLAKVSGFRLVFEHGMTLVGSREDLQERVQIPEAPGVDGVRIRDTLKRLTGR